MGPRRIRMQARAEMIVHSEGTRSTRILASSCRRVPLAAAMAFCFSAAVPAATINVGSSNLTAGVGNCTLLEAVKSVNDGKIAPGSGCVNYGSFGLDDTINLKNYAFSLSGKAAGGAITGETAIILTKKLKMIGNVDSNGKPLASIQRSTSAPDFRLIETSADLSLIGVRLQHGVAVPGSGTDSNPGDGGALLVTRSVKVDVTNSTISGNSATASGGGIYSTAALTIADSTISGNTAGTGNGGGIMSTYTTLSIDRSTISGNTAPHGQGGGIFADTANTELTNSTLQGNYAQRGGGGIYTDMATLNFCTISGNTTQAGNAGGGLLIKAYSTANATLMYGNNPGNDVDAEFSGPSLGGGYDLIGTYGGNILSIPADNNACDPHLGALADNGGATQTMALTDSSCAFDAGPALPPRDLVTDQRGNHYPRRIGMAADIGAFEVQPFDRIFIDGFD